MQRISYIALALVAACGNGWSQDPTQTGSTATDPSYRPGQALPSVPQTPGQLPEGAKFVFVTASAYVGNNVATHAEADEKCADSAEGAGLGRSFKAWLSEPGAQARAHIADVGPWYTPGCRERGRICQGPLFVNLASVKSAPTSDFFEDQHGSSVSFQDIWTASDADGTIGESCLTSEQATYGSLHGPEWSSTDIKDCIEKAHLLCLQQ